MSGFSVFRLELLNLDLKTSISSAKTIFTFGLFSGRLRLQQKCIQESFQGKTWAENVFSSFLVATISNIFTLFLLHLSMELKKTNSN